MAHVVNVVKTLITIIPKFSGGENESIQKVFKLIDLSAELAKISEVEKQIMLLNNLEGKALDFFMEVKNKNLNSN